MKRAVLAGVFVLALAAVLQVWVSHEKGRPLPEGKDQCLSCHAGVEGIEPGHAALSCAACHLGNRLSTEERVAHLGLVRIPGNAADLDRTCGAAGCHADLPHRFRENIMTTMSGVVSVERRVFGEPAGTRVSELGHSPADSHQRNLCASCHLANPKKEAGPLTERSRGGGCNACHLRYSDAARASLGKKTDHFVHAALSVKPEPIACFGCHSRSGRVSLNAEGWQEFEGDAGTAELRTLEDGRVVRRAVGDVHTERGLGCVDCHGSWEVMGTGAKVLHREDQSTVQCSDCHTATPMVTTELDPESARIAKLEGTEGRRYLTIAKSGVALVNTFVADGGLFLTGKYSGRTVALKPPAPACTTHRTLSCGSCHEAWVPQCVSCHTRFDPEGQMYDLLTGEQAPGSWLEEGGAPLSEPASLGVRLLGDGGTRVEEFAPGMIMTLEQNFHRLFAPVFAHTVRKEARACVDCHASPLALGYGRGSLQFDGGWHFTPRFPPREEDGLPEDAWIGFLQTRGIDSTTRENTRPFTVEEQRRILTVGACLTCHSAESPPMRQGLRDFPAVRKRMTSRCRE